MEEDQIKQHLAAPKHGRTPNDTLSDYTAPKDERTPNFAMLTGPKDGRTADDLICKFLTEWSHLMLKSYWKEPPKSKVSSWGKLPDPEASLEGSHLI